MSNIPWSETYSEATVNAAWSSLNGSMRQAASIDYFEFLDLVIASPLATVPLAAFETLAPENTCVLDAIDETRAQEMVERARLGTLEPQQPLMLGRFQERHVILAGNTLYRAALVANSDVRYLCIDFNQSGMCSTCWLS
jgi:hypothetical protein